MERCTLLELHRDDATFTATANAPGAGVDGSDAVGDGADSDDEAGTAGNGGRVRRVLALLVLFALLAAVAKALGGDDELDDLAALDAGEDADA